MRRALILMISTIILSGCAASGYQTFYAEYVDAKLRPDLTTLQQGEEPQVYGSDNMERDILSLRAKNYAVIGSSSFNGKYEDISNAVQQAKRVGATMVLVDSEYTNTETRSTTLFLPDNRTTYYSGNAYGSGGSASVYGSSTSYGSKAVPIQSSTRRYDQTAVFLTKFNAKPRIGISPIELPLELRQKLERNTGVLLEVIIEDSPAYYANVLGGDVLIAIDGEEVRNLKELYRQIQRVPKGANEITMTVIRDGKEKDITVEL